MENHTDKDVTWPLYRVPPFKGHHVSSDTYIKFNSHNLLMKYEYDLLILQIHYPYISWENK